MKAEAVEDKEPYLSMTVRLTGHRNEFEHIFNALGSVPNPVGGELYMLIGRKIGIR